MKKRITAVAICCALILSLIPFHASALTVISRVSFGGVPVPKVGQKPSDLIADIYTYSGAGYYVSSGGWFRRSGIRLFECSAGEVFAAGQTYVYRIDAYPYSGYEFDERENINADINGVQAGVGTVSENKRIRMFSISFELSNEITEIEIDNIKTPVIGQKPDNGFSGATMPKDSPYSIDSGGGWLLDNTWLMTGKVVGDKTYTAAIRVKADPGYVFPSNLSSVNATVNGKKCQVSKTSDSSVVTVSYPVKVSSVIPHNITLKAIKAPVLGQKTVHLDVEVPDDANFRYTKDFSYWYYSNALTRINNETTVFTTGVYYGYAIILHANEGYVFDDPNEYYGNAIVGNVSAYVSGVNSSLDAPNKYLALFCGFGELTDTIKSVALNISEPYAGERPSFNPELFTMGGYKVSSVKWYDMDVSGIALNASDRFIEGHRYSVSVALEPVTPDRFDVAEGMKGYFNRKQCYVTNVSGNGSLRCISRDFVCKARPECNAKKGDMDGDGAITVADALLALRIAAKLAPETAKDLAVGNVDGDAHITVADALAILRVAAKLSSGF